MVNTTVWPYLEYNPMNFAKVPQILLLQVRMALILKYSWLVLQSWHGQDFPDLGPGIRINMLITPIEWHSKIAYLLKLDSPMVFALPLSTSASMAFQVSM